MLRLSSINVTGTSYLGNLIISADNVSINNILSVNSTPTFSGNITFRNYSNEFMRITGEGKVGIGTTSPNSILVVNGGIDVMGGQQLKNMSSIETTGSPQGIYIQGKYAYISGFNDATESIFDI